MIFCQSCGMPITAPEHFGAEADGSPSSETIKREGKALEIGSEHNSMSRSEIINPRSRRRHAQLRGDSDLSPSAVHPTCQGRKTSLPKFKFTTDNAAMIATAGYYRYEPEENLFPAKCESRQYALMIRRPDA